MTTTENQSTIKQVLKQHLTKGLPQTVEELLALEYNAETYERDPSVPHAPFQDVNKFLTPAEKAQAVKNALRYFDSSLHSVLQHEFEIELERFGHIYMYRLLPREYEMKAYPLDQYPFKTHQAGAIMFMIMNNLDKRVAQYPHELVTYGGNGSVLSNWAQYHLMMKYLSEMEDDQTLVMYSGHPLGLFPSFSTDSPRCVITNGLMVSNYSKREDYLKGYALGVTQYGQMTAGSYCYIGPQGIVHGTTLTILNAFRALSGSALTSESNNDSCKGKVFITSGLGGMSGAQGKAGVIVGCITVVAEVNRKALEKRYQQGWVLEIESDVNKLIQRIAQAKKAKEVASIAYHGNVVDIWEALVEYEKKKEQEGNKEEILVELGSDQTSLHNPYGGGYYPVGLSFEQSNEMIQKDPETFKKYVQESLVRQITAINQLSKRGMKFYDYGNSFLLEAGRAGADVFDPSTKSGFKYPSYIQDIIGPNAFELGFGPFRWICLSNKEEDLLETDRIAQANILELKEKFKSNPKIFQQYEDNYNWIVKADHHKLVVGSQARILYSDALGRTKLALAFNDAIAAGKISAPIVLSRDHHDVSGADSPFRETSNIYDGSYKTADMSVHTVIGNSFRGATWVALHNGGGTGWGEASNCGFGLVLDGSKEAAQRAKSVLFWDVYNGIARRSWAGNENAIETIRYAQELEPKLKVTMPHFSL